MFGDCWHSPNIGSRCMETTDTLAEYTIMGNSLDEVAFNLFSLLAEHDWPGFRTTRAFDTFCKSIVLPGGPRFALENGLIPMEIELKFEYCLAEEVLVEALDCEMPYELRREDGFAILDASTSADLNDP